MGLLLSNKEHKIQMAVQLLETLNKKVNMPTKFEAPMCEAGTECEGWKVKGAHLTYTRKSGEHSFYVSAWAMAPEGYKLTKDNGPHEIGFVMPYAAGSKVEGYWAGMSAPKENTGAIDVEEYYSTTSLVEMSYKDYMESEDLADDDTRITYDTFWKKTDFSIKQKKGKSTMHSSAYRLLAPEAKKDKDLLTLKLKGETKL